MWLKHYGHDRVVIEKAPALGTGGYLIDFSGRVALLGDAAGCASLLAGEGTGLAMTEAYFLAGELHKYGGDLSRGICSLSGAAKALC